MWKLHSVMIYISLIEIDNNVALYLLDLFLSHQCSWMYPDLNSVGYNRQKIYNNCVQGLVRNEFVLG